MKRDRNNSLFDRGLLIRSLRASFAKLDPRTMVKNPIMFTVEAVTFVMLLLIVWIAVTGNTSQGSLAYNIVVFAVLLATVLFANFAESIAEARGKAQADSLRKTREETPAKRVGKDGRTQVVSSSALRQGDVFECVAGDTIAADGEIVEGLASIDESAITGESAPVIREAGGDKSSVTGGTRVLSDRILVEVTAKPGESFLDKMIALVEGSSRQKTPNEIALTILLAGFTLVFVIVCATLKPFADYVGANITVAAFISLFVCLIPTTIGGLLSAIGIAGMDRALRANVITKSGKAVETAGDIDTLLLDKTGTITVGNRKATRFYPVEGIGKEAFVRLCVLSSVADQTPEGKSVVELGAAEGVRIDPMDMMGVRMVKFTAETKCSGVDMPDGRRIRKGAAEAILRMAAEAGYPCPAGTEETVRSISENGGTPLIVCEDDRIRGVIELQDIIKTGIRERFERLHKMGVKTVMVTGDNPLTAKYIAEKAGVDDFIAEARPEDKLEYIRREQQSGKLVAMMGDGTNDAPALAQADVGVAMNSGTQAAKEAGNMVDLDNDPTKLIEIVEIGKQLLMTRGTLTTFSIANDVAKYFAIVPALFIASIPSLGALNIMHLHSPESAILSAVIFNAVIIPLLIPLALRGVAYKPIGASALLRRNLFLYGLGGIVVPFIGIKLIDLFISMFF
ncbi:MAG: potassium-transporting ATPase subunit KdpB [Rikenellaceae bacterium]|nr:potassium-transporting ATPase subunit KdpB [Rikenellaceae bacterium]